VGVVTFVKVDVPRDAMVDVMVGVTGVDVSAHEVAGAGECHGVVAAYVR
jgi:hypothetical protein